MRQRYNYLFETAVAIAVLVFVNIMWFWSDMGFTKASPNPYWIIVIFVAARYGSLQGVVAAILCSVTVLVSVRHNVVASQELTLGAIPYAEIRLSALFILFGFFIGEERSRINRILARQKELYNKLRKDFANLAMEAEANKDIANELGKRIVGQGDTVNTLYEIASRLAAPRPEALYASIPGLVTRVIGAEKSSLYILIEGAFLLEGQSGWGDGIASRKELDLSSDIIALAAREKRVVTVKDVFKAAGLKWQQGRDPVMAAPLFFGDEKETVTGFILIDAIPFLKVNPDSIRFLSSLADWSSKALDSSYSATRIRAKDYYDDEAKIYNYNYAVRRMRDELFSVTVSGRPSAMMLVRMEEFGAVPKAMKKSIVRTVGYVLRNTCRGSDVVARYNTDDTFMAILPGTDPEGARIVEKRVVQQIDQLGFRPFEDQEKKLRVTASICTIGPEAKCQDDLFKDAEKALAE